MTSAHSAQLPSLLVVGSSVVASFFAGKAVKWIRLPSLIGFMLVGVAAGPSLLNLIDESLQQSLSFITEIALTFVAISIGLELSFSSLRQQGKGIIAVILAESFGAFILVTLLVYTLTRDLPLALLFGAIAPASAPAGTVAVIREYRARGPLTRALYAVVGFDDGLGIVIFGFAAAVARTLLNHEAGIHDEGMVRAFLSPATEVVGGIVAGTALAIVFCLLARRLKDGQDVFILLFGFALASVGICTQFHLSIILTNMVFGMAVINTQPNAFVQRLRTELSNVLPLLFVLFFTLAGANLHVLALPSLGLLGLVYALSRSTGLIIGSRIGARVGRAGEMIRKYIGLGILSQAGVAIGLALIVKHEFEGLGPQVAGSSGEILSRGEIIGATILTTITATCIFFELIGPILTRVALSRAGEIHRES